MSAAARSSSYKIQGLVTLLYRRRISPLAATGISDYAKQGYNRDFFSSMYCLGYGGNYINRGLRSLSGRTKAADEEKPQFHMVKDENKKTQPTLPVSNKQGFSTWAKWLLGFLSLLLPFLKQKWERLRGLEGKAEKAVEEVEVVAEVVESVATVAEKASSEVAEKLPDNSKIKQAVLAVEHLSSVTAQEAQLTQDFIDKVGEMKQDLKKMETIADQPVMDKIVETHQQNVS